MNIPPQLSDCNIVPTAAKGKWNVGKNDIIKKSQFLDIPFSEISPDAWSKNGDYVSWTGFWKLPEELQRNILDIETKKGLDLGFKSGEQKDGRFIIVFDCDGPKADEYKDFLLSVYGKTFIRKSESGGYHLYYTTSGPILTGKQHIDLRHYLNVEDGPMELEIKQGSFVKFQGPGRSTDMDMDIQPLDESIDLCKCIQQHYPNTEMIKSFKEKTSSSTFVDKESLTIEDKELLSILETTYRPLYTSNELNGLRDSGVFLATIGFLRHRGLSKQNIQSVINWINSIDHEERHYDWNRTPDKMPGEPTMRRYGFDEFVDAINNLKTLKGFEVELPREPNRNTKRAAVYPSPLDKYPLSPVMEYTQTKENGDISQWYEPIAAGLEIIDAYVYLPLYEEIGVTTYDVKLKIRDEPVTYKKTSAEQLKNKLEKNHALYFNYDRNKSVTTFIEIIHNIALNRKNVGWTAGGRGIYYDENIHKIVAEDIPRPIIKEVKAALFEVNKLFDAMYPDTRDEMAGIMLWFLSGAFNLVRKQLGYGKFERQPVLINAGDIDRNKSEAGELGSYLWQPYHNMVLTERNSSSFNTKARRREAVGSSTIPIRVDEFDAKDTKTIAEFEEDLRDNYNSVYASIQQNNGDTRRTMLRALPYVTTNDRMQFQKPAFAKRAIIYETTGSIPKEAMEHYSKTKDTIDFTNWPKIGALATSLVIDKEINLKQPWNEFALELIEKIYKKCGIPLPVTWQIPTAFTQKNSQNLIDRNIEETLLHIMKRAIINKLLGTYDEERITTDIADTSKDTKNKLAIPIR